MNPALQCMTRTILLGMTLVPIGCGSSDQTTTDTATESPAPQPAQPSGGFQSETRTVSAEPKQSTTDTSAAILPASIRFTIQIGAFRDPHNASRIQSLARERFRLPVVSDYAADRKLYQIRVGFFQTREAASAFRQEMMRVYPSDYRGSWVVQLDNQ